MAKVTCVMFLRHRALGAGVSQVNAAAAAAGEEVSRMKALSSMCSLLPVIESPSEQKGVSRQFNSVQYMKNSIPLWEIK